MIKCIGFRIVRKIDCLEFNIYKYLLLRIYNFIKTGFQQVFKKTPPFEKSLISSVWKEAFAINGFQDDCSIYDFFSRRFSSDVSLCKL